MLNPHLYISIYELSTPMLFSTIKWWFEPIKCKFNQYSLFQHICKKISILNKSIIISAILNLIWYYSSIFCYYSNTNWYYFNISISLSNTKFIQAKYTSLLYLLTIKINPLLFFSSSTKFPDSSTQMNSPPPTSPTMFSLS